MRKEMQYGPCGCCRGSSNYRGKRTRREMDMLVLMVFVSFCHLIEVVSRDGVCFE